MRTLAMRRMLAAGLLGGGLPPLYDRILTTQPTKLLAYLPLNDTSGTVARNHAPARSGINIVKNGSFEISGTPAYGWTTDGGALVTQDATPHTGAYAIKLAPTGAVIKLVCANIPVKVGATYTLTAWTRGDGTNGLASVRVARGDYASFLLTESPANATVNYAQYTQTFTVPADSPTVTLEFRTPAVTGTMYVDDVTLSCNSADATIFDGTYLAGVTLNQPGLSGSCAVFGGTHSVKLDKAAYANSFPTLAAAGSYVIYGLPTLAALTDGVARWLMKFKTNVGATSNYIDCFKDATNNKLGWQHQDDGNQAIYQTTDWTTAAWFSLGAAWDAATGLDLYLNGLPVVTGIPITGAWTEAFSFTRMALGSDAVDGSSGGWIGSLQHFPLWETKLSASEMLGVSTANGQS
jgi:hypothetical protein